MNEKILELEAKILELDEQIRNEKSEDWKVLLSRKKIQYWLQIRELKLKL